MTNKPLTIDIQPPVSVYATYRRLSYQPWYAIAEFVDNSTQNYYNFKNELLEVYGKEADNFRIMVDYDPDENTLTIKDNANGTTHAVGLKRPNLWGLYDVHGNVWEWTSDPSGSNHVFRGGGWSSDARYLRSANRDRYAPDYRNGTLGFRLVRADE